MKKRISGIIAGIVILLLAFTMYAFAYSTGDVDGNGFYTAADARLVLRYSAKLENFNEQQKTVADVDNNGKIAAADARYILRVAARVDKPFGEIDTEKHLYLMRRKYAGCQTFTGTVKPVVIFVNEPYNRWTQEEMQAIMNESGGVINEIQRQAASFGQKLVISAEFRTAEITCNIKDDGWDMQALRSAGLPTEGIVNDALEKLYSVDEVPVIFIANYSGRACAVGGVGFEYVLLYDSLDGLLHELCHLFGATDYYYPDIAYKAAEKLFPGSIMLEGNKVDDLTAYNIGWTDTLSPTAKEFLKQTAYVTEKDIEDALNRQWISGYVTDWVTNHGVYTGYIRDGMFEGYGVYVYNSGMKYEGNWKSGLYDGYGVFKNSDGSEYDGYWKEGKHNGQGTLTYADGAVYSGNWKNSLRDGYGVLKCSDGVVYDGYWEEDKQSGQGTMTYPDGAMYSGNWKNSYRDGYGVFRFYNGDVYSGYWVAGMQHGNGTYTFSNGSSFSGIWQNGNYIG